MGQALRSLSGIHVLFVDDNVDAREIVGSYLRYYGAIVQVAASAEAALDAYRRVTPDIVITDLAMPGRDGTWLLKEIRMAVRGFAVPVIALTAFGGRYDRALMLHQGFDDYLTKPVSAEHICAAVARLVGR
ncbi:MAG TPA: response regulator [Candidatus Limnocylindria bacterium]|nr:response regulator [Candidatus Limnocylindria bacterium]